MELSAEEASAQSGHNAPVDVEFHGNIAVVTMRCGENRFNKAFCEKLNQALDKVEANEDAKALVTVGEGKFYSNGLDLNWLGMLGQSRDSTRRFLQFRDDHLQPIFERFATFGLPTIAVLNGHCFAAGAILALCHDYRVMRSDKGWFCLNEVHIGLYFNSMMKAIIQSKIPGGTAYLEAAVLGRRYTGPEAVTAGIAHSHASADHLLITSLRLAEELGSKDIDRGNLERMKTDMYADIVETRRALYGKEDASAPLVAKPKL